MWNSLLSGHFKVSFSPRNKPGVLCNFVHKTIFPYEKSITTRDKEVINGTNRITPAIMPCLEGAWVVCRKWAWLRGKDSSPSARLSIGMNCRDNLIYPPWKLAATYQPSLYMSDIGYIWKCTRDFWCQAGFEHASCTVIGTGMMGCIWDQRPPNDTSARIRLYMYLGGASWTLEGWRCSAKNGGSLEVVTWYWSHVPGWRGSIGLCVSFPAGGATIITI